VVISSVVNKSYDQDGVNAGKRACVGFGDHELAALFILKDELKLPDIIDINANRRQ
jgi:hypothetical protein